MAISIHAPSRERQLEAYQHIRDKENFNPRSLAGATPLSVLHTNDNIISIHAPSRERLTPPLEMIHKARFQSTLPRGSDL